MTVDQLQQLVAARNIVAAGGIIDTDVGRFAVKPGGELNAVDEMNSIIAGLPCESVVGHQGSGYQYTNVPLGIRSPKAIIEKIRPKTGVHEHSNNFSEGNSW